MHFPKRQPLATCGCRVLEMWLVQVEMSTWKFYVTNVFHIKYLLDSAGLEFPTLGQLLAFLLPVCLTLWAHEFASPANWEESITWREGTRVQIQALTCAVRSWKSYLCSLCLVASFHDEDFGLNVKLSAAETSLPHTSEFTLLWWDAACQLWSELSLLAAPPLALIPALQAVSTSLGSPLPIRGFPPHSSGVAS